MEIISWILFIVFIAGLLTVGAMLLRDYLTGEPVGGSLSAGLFTPKPQLKRLDVVDQTTIDGRRRLMLIRRDNVEHLIMIGGPVDVVIETNIGANNKLARPEPLRPVTSQNVPRSAHEDRPSENAPQLDRVVGE